MEKTDYDETKTCKKHLNDLLSSIYSYKCQENCENYCHFHVDFTDVAVYCLWSSWLFGYLNDFSTRKKVFTMLFSSIPSNSKTLVRAIDHYHMMIILKHTNNTSEIFDFEKWRIKEQWDLLEAVTLTFERVKISGRCCL